MTINMYRLKKDRDREGEREREREVCSIYSLYDTSISIILEQYHTISSSLAGPPHPPSKWWKAMMLIIPHSSVLYAESLSFSCRLCTIVLGVEPKPLEARAPANANPDHNVQYDHIINPCRRRRRRRHHHHHHHHHHIKQS